MTDTITISLTPENQLALEELGRQEQEGIDDIINQALSDFLFIRRFREIRARMTKGIEKLGIDSDDDVFKLVS